MNLLQTLPPRWLNLAGFAICAALLGFAYYLQFHEGLDPCPLCIFQRIGVILLGLAGAGIATRHVWLQHLPPDQVPACGPDLGYMLEILPIAEVIRRVFTASGECANIVWSFLGLSMPAWVLMWFLVLGTLGLVGNWISRPR
jgi:disulfide bond formation protein DsbB